MFMHRAEGIEQSRSSFAILENREAKEFYFDKLIGFFDEHNSMDELFLKRLLRKKNTFRFEENITVNAIHEKRPKGLKDIDENAFESRYCAEFNCSLATLQAILSEEQTSLFHGQFILDKQKIEHIQRQLRRYLVAIYVDVKNVQTDTWDRIKSYRAPGNIQLGLRKVDRVMDCLIA